MDKLWAPWRVKYVTKIIKRNRKRCVFCDILRQKKDKKNYIFIRTKNCFSVLNIYPYNNGHALVMPNRHIGNLFQLSKEERDDLFDLLEETKFLLDKVLKPDGYNVGMNLGKSAGAGFPDHVHIHIVPRWIGDVNFMPVLADTKIISQSLTALYKKLSDAYKKRLRRIRR